MAIVWTKTAGDNCYEVRKAGHSIRLYTNGVFHSQFNAQRPIAANVWNLLLLPAFFRPLGQVQRVLVLGVGGGAVIRLLHQCVRPNEIIGVELDPTHLYIARRFFGVTRSRAALVEADARDWLDRYTGPPFDLIVDDLFGHARGEAARTVGPDDTWLSLLSGNLSDQGVLAINLFEPRALRKTERRFKHLEPGRFATALSLSLPGYENRVGVFASQPMPVGSLRAVLRDAGSLCASRLAGLPFNVRRLKS